MRACLDVVYVFQHSRYDDLEIRYSLRSIAKHLPWVRKDWIFGESPVLLSDDKSRIECVLWKAMARVGRFRTPLRSFFLQCFLLSLRPELDAEFVLLCDDDILLDSYSATQKRRCQERMALPIVIVEVTASDTPNIGREKRKRSA